MPAVDIANKALDFIEKGDIDGSKSLYSNDFTFTGPVPMALNKDQYLDLMKKVSKGVPNWNFNRHDLRVEGQTVFIPVQVSGKQTGTISSLMPGMPDVPATNRSFRIPPEVIRATFRGDQIVEIHIDPVPGGGIPGMLEQLGVKMPMASGH